MKFFYSRRRIAPQFFVDIEKADIIDPAAAKQAQQFSLRDPHPQPNQALERTDSAE